MMKHFQEFLDWLVEKSFIELEQDYWEGNLPVDRLRYQFFKERHPEECDKIIKSATDKNRALKTKFVKMLGGRCKRCGFHENIVALEFHHKFPKNKWSKDSYSGYQQDPERFEQDIKDGKIDLMCANCHRIYHAGKKKSHRDWFVYRSD